MREDHDVPSSVRRAVIERDGSCCRVCGVYCELPALHHIEYRSEGGDNSPENLITIGWLPGHDCHLSVVHANKRLWQPILKQVVIAPPGVTAFSIFRAERGHSFGSPRRGARPSRPLVGWPTQPHPGQR